MMTNQLKLVPPTQSVHGLLDIESLTESLDSSLANLSGKKVLFRSDYSKEVIPLQVQGQQIGSLPYEIRQFSTSPRERRIIGIDSSCALIGETEEGRIFAGRVAIVSSSRFNSREQCRAGPFIFYMDQKFFTEGPGSLLPRKVISAIISDSALAERFVRIRLERFAQLQVAQTNSEGIILLDGSLKSSILETGALSLREVERVSQENSNQIAGISKTSRIRLISKAAEILQSTRKVDSYFDITDFVGMFMQRLISRVLVAKFSPNSQVFRVDMSRANAECDSQVLADMKYNDVFFRGYPETLRLAHHFSIFDPFTIFSIRSYISKRYGLVKVAADDLRETILGKLV